MPREHCFAGADPWADALAGRVEEIVRTAISERGMASLVLSGGSTPVPLFERLAGIDWDWSRLHLTLADERWVTAEDPASNERLVRETLLVRPSARQAHFTGLYTGAALPAAACEEVTDRINALPRPFDLVLLGIGDDAHTASLFPAQPDSARAFSEGLVCVQNEAPTEPRLRLSLGPGALLDARQIIFHLRGAGKWDVYRAALAETDTLQAPAGYFLRAESVPVDVYWSSR